MQLFLHLILSYSDLDVLKSLSRRADESFLLLLLLVNWRQLSPVLLPLGCLQLSLLEVITLDDFVISPDPFIQKCKSQQGAGQKTS